MASRFSLQKPYVVASLPRPIDHKNGTYVVGSVYGGASGSKKRKRSELAVGIDGESVNLYDISSSKLITSYAFPPQSSFTCPPSSIRIRVSKSKFERRTYTSTLGTQSQITLFRDHTNGLTSTHSSTISRNIENSANPIIFMDITAATLGADISSSYPDLLIVKKDGEIQCLDGESLQDKWISPGSALLEQHDLKKPERLQVEYAHLTSAYAASQTMLKDRQDVFDFFSQEISEASFNPDILVIITKSVKSSSFTRRLHIVASPRKSSTHLNGLQHSVHPLLVSKFPNNSSQDDRITFNIQISTGTLQQLTDNLLTTFDLTRTGPKRQSTLALPGADSVLRLSSTSVMVSFEHSIAVYNPKYQSILASAELSQITENNPLKRKRDGNEFSTRHRGSCNLSTYFHKLGIAVAIVDNNLVAIQVEGHQDRHGRSRAAGLLIDSLGQSTKEQLRPGFVTTDLVNIHSKTLEAYLPGPITISPKSWNDELEAVEAAFVSGNSKKFDELVAPKLKMKLNDTKSGKPQINGSKPENGTQDEDSDVDRRWVRYALGKIFSRAAGNSDEHHLKISFYPPNVFLWLIDAGHITVGNIESALRLENSLSSMEPIPAGDLVSAIVGVNPDMDLLLILLRENYLGAAEILPAIRALMDSLEMLDNIRTKQRLLTSGDEWDLENGDVEEQVMRLEAQAEKELALAEYKLGPGSGVRGQALSLGLSKLYTCPTSDIVRGLQTTFTSQEVVSLIYLLRFELARGAWTTRYLDVDHSEVVDEESEAQGNTLILISSLLGNCIDAIGAGGWLSGGSKLVNGDPFEAEELISSLKLEISAALECIEEATYMTGLTAEMIRFGEAFQDSIPTQESEENQAKKKRKGRNAPIILPSLDPEFRLLPLGMKVEQQISLLKVGAGGELSRRSARDIGYLKSQKVGKYTLERIVI